MLQVILEKLQFPDYWRKSYHEWGLESWSSFFHETKHDKSLQVCRASLVAELKTLTENLAPGMCEAKKALALRNLEVSISLMKSSEVCYTVFCWYREEERPAVV
ncbi:24428_t:CDS:1, partial [Dentiscutata erythropus]